MPVRFRKSFKIFPGVKVNMSKGGISFTVGAKGYHLNFSKRGVRQTVGLPGSGISQTSYLMRNEPEHKTSKKDTEETDAHSDKSGATEEDEGVERQEVRRRGSPLWLLLLSLVVIYFGGLVLGLIPSNFLSQLFHSLTDLTRGIGL